MIGTDAHLVCDDPDLCMWSPHVPQNAWHLSGVVKHTHAFCLDTAAALLGVQINTSPGERFERAFKTVSHELRREQIPWAYAIPKRDHIAFVKSVVNSAHKAMDPITLDYLASTWADGTHILERLARTRIDIKLHRELIASESSDSVKAALASFAPDDSGFAQSVCYDRLATTTGRLTVAQGPQILTLRKDLRKILVSRRGRNGAIVALDFSALEPRIVLRTTGMSDPGTVDLYSSIANEIGGNVTRDAVKTCVLSILFGAGRRSTAERLGVDGPEVDAFISRMNSRFGFNKLGSALSRIFSEQNMLRNAFGRPLLVTGHEQPSDSLLVSHYTQATGVDVALTGFANVAAALTQTAPKTRPLFVLHDALFFDVPLSELDAVQAVSSIDVQGFDAPFQLKFEVIRCDA